ncbi:MAG: aminopeptidase P N-terminal domain-containing protein, partial [Candidatus Margulisiibacteriota bacterium]
MFPRPPLFINDDLAIDQYTNRSIRRRKWLMEHCHGPIVLLAPEYGPNQMYAWANCFCPVYQDSYILYLTGINQLGIAIILDPVKNEHHIFLPKYNSKTIFWDGDYFSYGDKRSHDFLSQLGFTHIHAKNQLDQIISQYSQNSIWHLLIQKVQKKYRRDDQFLLKQRLSRRFKSNFKFKNIEGLSWQQRFSHDATAINCAKQGAKKTEIAFRRLLTQSPFNSETQLAGQLIGELLKETCFGLSFSPIVARDKNAATLHYTANSEQCKNNSLILLDFGIRWQSMCTDVSRTIPSQGRYTDLQKRLMAIVLSTLSVTQQKLKAGVTFKELNDFAWQHLETTLQQEFL